MTDFLNILFTSISTPAEVEAGLAVGAAIEAARLSALKAEMVEAATAARCTRCGGTGRLSQFMHRNNGVCYGCGGSGAAS